MNNYDAKCISGCWGAGGDLCSAVGDNNLHGAFGLPISGMGDFIYRNAYRFSLDAAWVLPPPAHFHYRRIDSRLGVGATSQGISLLLEHV